jgi:hypothetical protein
VVKHSLPLMSEEQWVTDISGEVPVLTRYFKICKQYYYRQLNQRELREWKL